MDRILYLAMSAAKNTLQAQAVNSHNLANISTPGFRADLSQFRSMPVDGDGHGSRVYALQERPGVDFSYGSMDYTGNELDIAVNGHGWFAIMLPDGTEGYSRAGDLRITATGILANGAGYPILGNAGPITLTPADKIEIAVDGTISIRPTGQDEKTITVLDRIKLVNPPDDSLYKGMDGQFRMKDGSAAVPDASIRLVPGALEMSNVSMVEGLVDMISLARQFEMSIKAMETAEANDQSAQTLLRFTG